MTIGIEPPINRNVTEGVNSTVEYCVVITTPDMTDPIERSDFNICVSTMDGTAIGKDNNCSTPLTPCIYLYHEVNGKINVVCTLNSAIHV